MEKHIEKQAGLTGGSPSAPVCGLAVAAVAAAGVLRWLFDPFLGDHLPFATFFVAVAMAAALGGLRPALLATVLGFVVTLYFFVPPRHSFVLPSGPHLFGLAMYFMVSLTFAGFGEAMRLGRLRVAEQGERLRTTLASIGDAVITTDVQGRITNMNAVAETLTGWATADAVGQPLDVVFNIVNEETRRKVDNPATRALKEGVIVGLANHTALIGKDGTERPIDDSAAPIRCKDGEVVGCVLVFRDISDRHDDERRLRESEERLRLAQKVAKIGTFEWNIQTGVNVWTPELEAMYGLKPGEFAGTQATWEGLVHPDDRPHAVRSVEQAMTHGEFSDEWRVVWPDGSVHRLAGRGYVFKDGEGRPLKLVGVNIDITERWQAAERFRLAADAVNGIIYECDVRTGNVERSRGLYEIVGYHPGDVPPTTQWWTEQIHPDDRERVLRVDPDVIRPSNAPVEYRLRHKDGRWLHVEDRAVVVRDGNGHPIKLVGCTVDVTERKKAERTLEENRKSLYNLIEWCPFGIYIVDADFRIASVNAGSQDKAFANVRHLIGRPFNEAMRILWPEPVAAECIRIFRHTLATGEPYSSSDFVSPRADIDRTEGYEWELHRISLPDGRYGVVCYYFDATRLRQVERELREAGEQQRLLSETAAVLLATDEPDAMLKGLFGKIASQFGLDAYLNFMVDETGNRLRLASSTGFPDEVCRSLERLDFGQAVCGTVALSHQPFHACRIQESEEPKVQLVRSLGLRVYACFPLMADRNLLGTLSFASRSRDEFAPVELSFFQTVCTYVATTYERLRLVSQLSDANQKKDEFLATLAHELRNPLAPIRNGLQVMKLAGNDRDTVERSRSMMERQFEQMVRLVDDLMDVSRITRGKVELKKQRVRLSAVVGSAVEACRPLIDQMGHELTVTLPAQPIIVDADPTRLAQVFANLLNNAAKYSEPGGHVCLTVERQGSDVVVSVKDTGIGIPANKLTSIFDMFSQVDRSLERSQGGLGIGLSLVKGLVEMHGGRVEAKSEGLGQGSEFLVRLPVVVEASIPPTDDRSERPAPRSSLNILIVDDNRDGADSLAMMLKIMGNQTHTAYDGKEGVEVAERVRPDVVLLDIGLPKMNGFEVCRHLRQQPWAKSVILIAVTGWGQEEDRRRSHDAGFDHHMVKPVDPTALMKLLAELHGVLRA